MAYQYHCLNPIAAIGLDRFDGQYTKTEDDPGSQRCNARDGTAGEAAGSSTCRCRR